MYCQLLLCDNNLKLVIPTCLYDLLGKVIYSSFLFLMYALLRFCVRLGSLCPLRAVASCNERFFLRNCFISSHSLGFSFMALMPTHKWHPFRMKVCFPSPMLLMLVVIDHLRLTVPTRQNCLQSLHSCYRLGNHP